MTRLKNGAAAFFQFQQRGGFIFLSDRLFKIFILTRPSLIRSSHLGRCELEHSAAPRHSRRAPKIRVDQSSFRKMSSCAIVLPSSHAWAQALGAHLGLMLGALLPASLLLYVLPRNRIRMVVGVLIALAGGVGTPVLVAHFRTRHAVGWMTAFLASTFGFSCFFKSLAAAFDAHPEGADADLKTWVLWFTSLPEPEFAKGKLVRAPSGALTQRALLFLAKAISLFGLLSGLQNSPHGAHAPFSDDGGLTLRMLNGAAHLWLVFLWAAFCLDVGTLLVLLQGSMTAPGFRNPLLASRSFKEAWGERWNLPVHAMLKRSVYVPLRRRRVGPVSAAMLTFVGSGLLHEYNFSIHNHSAYQPGHATAFFVTMGAMMLAEGALGRAVPHWLARWYHALPDALVALFIQSTVLPIFTPLFFRSWLEAGMLASVAELVPHLRCGRT